MRVIAPATVALAIVFFLVALASFSNARASGARLAAFTVVLATSAALATALASRLGKYI